MKKKLTLFCSLIIAINAGNAQSNKNATQKVKNLYGNLMEVAWETKGVLFGQEFFNSYRWPDKNFDDPNVSDVKSVTGKHPAVLGQDFQYYNEKTKEEVDRHTKAAKRAYELGCIITFDYHILSKNHTSTLFEESDKILMYNIAEQNDTNGDVTWLKIELDKAIKIINDLNMPIVFRPFHEMNGNWFWWGSKADGGAESYIKMYQFTVNYVNARTKNVLWEWSPNHPFDEIYYPGDNYVDVVGVDLYDQGNDGYKSLDYMVEQLEQVTDFAKKHNKIPVFAEVGNRITGPDEKPNWWSDIDAKIQSSDRAFNVAWMLTWINQPWGNPAYVAHSGSSEEGKKGFNNFANSSTTLMQPDAAKRNMYDKSKWNTTNNNKK